MGYNKVVFLCNDAERQVTDDPAGWWDSCRNAFYRLMRKDCNTKTYVQEPETFGHGSYCNYWQAVWNEHADVVAVILAGGNHATVLGSCTNGGQHHDEESQLEVLRHVLDRMGYRISKKAAPKRNRTSRSGNSVEQR